MLVDKALTIPIPVSRRLGLQNGLSLGWLVLDERLVEKLLN